MFRKSIRCGSATHDGSSNVSLKASMAVVLLSRRSKQWLKTEFALSFLIGTSYTYTPPHQQKHYFRVFCFQQRCCRENSKHCATTIYLSQCSDR